MVSETSFEDELSAMLPRMRRFAHALSKSPSDADDLTQMAAERALRSRSQYQAGSRLDHWLFRITRNLWIDTVRARSRRSRFEAPEQEAERVGADPRAGMDAALELQRVMAAMQRIPEEQREIVALILIEGFGYRETAEMLDLPIGTVASRLARGRTALLELWGNGNDR